MIVGFYIAAWAVLLAFSAFWYYRRRDIIGMSACAFLALVAVVLLVLPPTR